MSYEDRDQREAAAMQAVLSVARKPPGTSKRRNPTPAPPPTHSLGELPWEHGPDDAQISEWQSTELPDKKSISVVTRFSVHSMFRVPP